MIQNVQRFALHELDPDPPERRVRNPLVTLLTNVRAGQAWLDSFTAIAERLGGGALVKIGRAIPEHARWPPGIRTVHEGLASIDVAYHLNHRIEGRVLYDPLSGRLEEGIGHYRYERHGPRSALLLCHNPYPCAFDLGIIQAVVERLHEAGQAPSVQHSSGPCRQAGGETCTYLATW